MKRAALVAVLCLAACGGGSSNTKTIDPTDPGTSPGITPAELEAVRRACASIAPPYGIEITIGPPSRCEAICFGPIYTPIPGGCP